MKKSIIFLSILLSINFSFANQDKTKEKDIKKVNLDQQKVEIQSQRPRCKWSDTSCDRRPQSKASLALKRLSRF